MHAIGLILLSFGTMPTAQKKAAAGESRFVMKNAPNLPLIRPLQKADVEVIVYGQALSDKKIEQREVTSDIPVAAVASTVLVHRQADGFAYVPGRFP